jgi:pimeloyl-ACP methyl ester carboxylesterase
VNPTLKRILIWLGELVLALMVLALLAFLGWAMNPLGPTQTALDALVSDSTVTVTQSANRWEFAPTSGAESSAALIYYPGGHVDARSYAPYARDLAAQGYLVVIPVMPLSLAVLSPNAADKVVAAHPTVSSWVIGGHSLGGAMAGQYVAKHPGAMGGIVLQGSYVPSGSDLSQTDIAALTQVGTLDTVVNRDNLAAGKALLPASAVYEDLEGGNHAQFGDYGPQPGDTPNPPMSAAEQRRLAVEGSVAILRRAKPTP